MFRDGLRIGGIDCRVSGAWVAGDLLKFNGSQIVAGSAAGLRSGSATVDFGGTFTDSASVTVTGQTWVTSGSHVEAFLMDDVTADNTAGEHEALAQDSKIVVTNRSAGNGFRIDLYTEGTLGKGQFTVHWLGA